MLAYCTKYLSK